MADKLRTKQQTEALQAKYLGTGNADTSKREWAANVSRDTKASVIGHPAMLDYYALATGQHRELARIELIRAMINPLGETPAPQGWAQCMEGEELKTGEPPMDAPGREQWRPTEVKDEEGKVYKMVEGKVDVDMSEEVNGMDQDGVQSGTGTEGEGE